MFKFWLTMYITLIKIILKEENWARLLLFLLVLTRKRMGSNLLCGYTKRITRDKSCNKKVAFIISFTLYKKMRKERPHLSPHSDNPFDIQVKSAHQQA